MLLIAPLVIVILEQARVIHERVNCVDDIFVGDRPPSVVRKFLDFLDPLHQLLERPVFFPRLRQVRTIYDEVLALHLPVLCEEVCDDFPHPEMGEYPIAVKLSGKKFFLTASAIFFFPARSRFIHSLNSLPATAWSRWRFPEVTLFFPDGMMSLPGLGGITNEVPGATIA